MSQGNIMDSRQPQKIHFNLWTGHYRVCMTWSSHWRRPNKSKWFFQNWKIFLNNLLQKLFQWWQFIGVGLGTIILIFISHPFELLKYVYLIFK
jgi:hypothetical protein